MQKILEKKRPIVATARLGGERGMRLTRAAFGPIIKFSDLSDSLSSMIDEIDLSWMEIKNEKDNTERDNKLLNVIKSHIDFEAINKRWEAASRIRIWVNE